MTELLLDGDIWISLRHQSGNVVAISAGTLSSLALVDENAPFDGTPFVVQHPFSETIQIGKPHLFVVNAVGKVPLRYQWQLDGVNIEGANRSTLFLTNVSAADFGSYQCVVSNSLGSVTSTPGILSRSVPQFDVSSLAWNANGFQLQLNGLSGHGEVVIYASGDLAAWTPIFTNPPVVGTLSFMDSSATNQSLRFYRAMER